MLTSLKDYLAILSGFLTPLIAILAIIIAYRQYEIQKYRVRMDLFERRLKIYQAIMNFMRYVRQHGSANDEQLFEFIDNSSLCKFLFKGKIKKHIDVLLQEALNLQEISITLSESNLPKGDDRTRLAKEKTMHFKNLRDQYDKTDELFMKYLKLY